MTTRFSTLLIIALSIFLAQPKTIAQPETASSRPIPGHVSTNATQGRIDAGVSVGTIQSNVQSKGQKNYSAPAGFLVTTTSSIDGYSILEYKGLVEGAAVRVPTWNEDASAGQQEVYGGSIDSYAHMCEEARVQAFTTMIDRAKKIGANAVIGIHFDSQVMPLDKGKFASGVVCVGTAISAKRK